MSPFAMLERIEQRSQQVTAELPPKINTQLHWTGLGFNLLGQRFVAPLNEVAETMRIPPATRLPGVKDFVSGVGNVRGRLMALVDLAVFFGKTSKLPKAQRRVLAVEDADQFFGFIIDESLGMQHFPSDSFDETLDEIDDRFKPFVRGGYRLAGIQWPLVSLIALAEHPEMKKLAAIS
ncbi:MAG: chemotaxis protein CheW [Pseudomonadales bacterium]